jgi:hypothetical protein
MAFLGVNEFYYANIYINRARPRMLDRSLRVARLETAGMAVYMGAAPAAMVASHA